MDDSASKVARPNILVFLSDDHGQWASPPYGNSELAEDRRDCYWLYVVTDCATAPNLQQPIPDSARYPWHEVTKVAHYFLSVNALQQPMEIRETERGYNAEPKP